MVDFVDHVYDCLVQNREFDASGSPREFNLRNVMCCCKLLERSDQLNPNLFCVCMISRPRFCHHVGSDPGTNIYGTVGLIAAKIGIAMLFFAALLFYFGGCSIFILQFHQPHPAIHNNVNDNDNVNETRIILS